MLKQAVKIILRAVKTICTTWKWLLTCACTSGEARNPLAIDSTGDDFWAGHRVTWVAVDGQGFPVLMAPISSAGPQGARDFWRRTSYFCERKTNTFIPATAGGEGVRHPGLCLVCRTSAGWRRSAPCPVLGAPDLLWPSKGSRPTPVANDTPVCVRRLPTAFYLCVCHFCRFFTLHSWITYSRVGMATGVKHKCNLTNDADGSLHLHRRGHVHPSLSPCSFWCRVLPDDTWGKVTVSNKEIKERSSAVRTRLPLITDGCSSVSKLHSGVQKLSV